MASVLWLKGNFAHPTGIKRALSNPFSSVSRLAGACASNRRSVLQPSLLRVAAEDSVVCGTMLSSGWELFPDLALLLCSAPATSMPWAPASHRLAFPADKCIDLPDDWELGTSQQGLFLSLLLIRYPKLSQSEILAVLYQAQTLVLRPIVVPCAVDHSQFMLCNGHMSNGGTGRLSASGTCLVPSLGD